MIGASMRILLFIIAAIGLFGQETPDIDALLKTAREAHRKGDYAAAQQPLEDALRASDALPKEDPRRYDILKELSAVLSASGQNDKAENYIELAINWRETVVGREDPLIAGDLIELATVCERLKDFDRSIAILERVVNMHTKEHGTFENNDVADDISRIALVQVSEEKPEQAILSLFRVIGIREKLYGADSPALLPELDRLGAAQVTAHDYASAETTFRRALVIRERIEGAQSPDLLTTLDGLAYSLFGQKKYDDAEVYYKRLLNLWTLINNLPMIAETYEKIALFYREQGKWDQGTEAASNAIAKRALISAVGLSTEATAWIAHGNKAHAVELYRKALALLDPNRPDHDGLRDQIEHVLAGLEPSASPKGTKATTAKKKQP